MIDPLSEQVISLADAAKLLPARRGGKRPHVSCIYRWTVAGCRGVVLDSIQVGATRCTSREALAAFIERLTAARAGLPAAHIRTPTQRTRAAAAAEKELSAAGY